MTDFICAYFGQGWTTTARGFETAVAAQQHGLFMMPSPGVLGFAIIAEKGGEWKLDDDMSILSPKCEVVKDSLSNFNVLVA